MTEREEIAWLYRRVGFGLEPGRLDELEALGTATAIDQLVDPDASGVPTNPDPWADVVYRDYQLQEFRSEDRVATIVAWMLAMLRAPRPVEEWMRFFWHGHLVTGMQKADDPQLMVKQLRMFGEFGLGNFRDLIYETTIDPAMLVYLDGRGSEKGAPNENYGRELLELFTLGIGNYTETDIQRGAAALTGWRVPNRRYESVFDARIHDDTPQEYLGVTGVNDVDSVVAAVVNNEACPVFIARSLAKAILGADVDEGLVEDLGARFAGDGLEIRPLVRNILEAGVDGAATEKIMRPVEWTLLAMKATQAAVDEDPSVIGRPMAAMGQIPLYPPNVSGWPGDSAWLSSSVTAGRFNTAAAVAYLTPPESPARQLAAVGDYGALADLLCHPEGFSDATLAALDEAASAGDDDPGLPALLVALASPDLIQA